MANRIIRGPLFVILALAAWSPPPAAGIDWKSAQSGDFLDPSRWTSNSVPTSSDPVRFNLGANYTVSFSGPATVNYLNAFGGVSLDLNGESLTTNSYFRAGGSASVTISNGGSLLTGYYGSVSGSGSSQMTITGVGSSWNIPTNTLRVGWGVNNSNGLVTVTNGATLTSAGAQIGQYDGSRGTVVVTGAGSKWTQTSAYQFVKGIDVGYGNSAQGANGSGYIRVEDHGAMENSGWITVGDRGYGEVQVSGAGRVTNLSTVVGGYSYGIGKIFVDGVGSLWTDQTSTKIGYQGLGSLSVSNGSALNSPVLTNYQQGSVDILNATVASTVSNLGVFRDNGVVVGGFTNSSGGSLSGAGRIDGSLALMSGSTISPGNSMGTLTAGATTWNGGATFQFFINSAEGTSGGNSGWNLLNINGRLSLAGAGANPEYVKLQSLFPNNEAGAVFDFDPSRSYVWPFATAAGGITGFTPGEFVIDTSGFTNPLGPRHFEVRQIGNSLALAFIVPEPSDMALTVMALLGLAFVAMRHLRS